MPKKLLPKLVIVTLSIFSVFILPGLLNSQLPGPNVKDKMKKVVIPTYETIHCGNCGVEPFRYNCFKQAGKDILKIWGTSCRDYINIVYGIDSQPESSTTPSCYDSRLYITPSLLCPGVDELEIRGKEGNDTILLDSEPLTSDFENPELAFHARFYGQAGDDILSVMVFNEGTNEGAYNFEDYDPAFFGHELFGGSGKDQLIGGPGSDILRGGPGDDNFLGYEEIDYIYGDNDNDCASLLGLGPDIYSSIEQAFFGTTANSTDQTDGCDFGSWGIW